MDAPFQGTDAPLHELAEAVRAMRYEVDPRRFALVGFGAPPAEEELAALDGDGPVQIVREAGETTMLVEQSLLDGILARHRDASVETELRWIRFVQPMAWDLVGFLALVTSRLAGAGVPLGAVCGFTRDHLFLADRHLAAARRVLDELSSRRADR